MNIKLVRIYNDEIHRDENNNISVQIPVSNNEILVVGMHDYPSILDMIHSIWNIYACIDPSNTIYIFYNEDDTSMANMIGMCSVISDYEPVFPIKNNNI